MTTASRDKIYHALRIEASVSSTEIWLGDSDGHLVQKAVGVLDTSLLPGDYFVEFGLGGTTYPIALHEPTRYTEAELSTGPSCPRPKVRFTS